MLCMCTDQNTNKFIRYKVPKSGSIDKNVIMGDNSTTKRNLEEISRRPDKFVLFLRLMFNFFFELS